MKNNPGQVPQVHIIDDISKLPEFLEGLIAQMDAVQSAANTKITSLLQTVSTPILRVEKLGCEQMGTVLFCRDPREFNLDMQTLVGKKVDDLTSAIADWGLARRAEHGVSEHDAAEDKLKEDHSLTCSLVLFIAGYGSPTAEMVCIYKNGGSRVMHLTNDADQFLDMAAMVGRNLPENHIAAEKAYEAWQHARLMQVCEAISADKPENG